MTNNSKSKGTSYADAGVNIDAGNELVERIKPAVLATQNAHCIGGIGGFGGLFALPEGYKQPILVSGTDGVGTKLKLAIEAKRHDGVGIDLVAMCVNDILVLGAKPLFFLDYYASGLLQNEVAEKVIKGIARGCEIADMALIGGETAELPGMYQQDDYDLAGFCVGIVERQNIIDGKNIKAGDRVIGLASSGPHSNGYSLIRKVINDSGHNLQDTVSGKSLADWLLEPTRIYVKLIHALLQQTEILGMAHITGGGLLENIPRILPKGLGVQLDQKWDMPDIFYWLRETGNIDAQELYRTFNCGIGMAIIVKQEHAAEVLGCLQKTDCPAWDIGEVDDQPGVKISP